MQCCKGESQYHGWFNKYSTAVVHGLSLRLILTADLSLSLLEWCADGWLRNMNDIHHFKMASTWHHQPRFASHLSCSPDAEFDARVHTCTYALVHASTYSQLPCFQDYGYESILRTCCQVRIRIAGIIFSSSAESRADLAACTSRRPLSHPSIG